MKLSFVLAMLAALTTTLAVPATASRRPAQMIDEFALTPSVKSQYERYRVDTIKSIEAMRAPNGLVNDKVFVQNCHSRIMALKTTPTNIGLDIINQVDLLSDIKLGRQALRNLNTVMVTLSHMRLHDSGLFFSVYSTAGRARPVNLDVSSVDNIHMALALWTAAKVGAKSFPKEQFGMLAARILNDMNFSVFTAENGMLWGNLSAKNRWQADAFQYDYIGSEARSIYALVKALRLLKPMSDGKRPWPVDLPKYHELYSRDDHPIMKTWDGGAFQLLLPEMLLNEDRYTSQSSILKQSFDDYALHVLDVERERDYDLPAVFSACDQGYGRTAAAHESTYNGKAGSKELAASANKELRTSDEAESTATPHGIFMAATRAPRHYAVALKEMEKLHSLSTPGVPFYCEGLGFMDGYRVQGAGSHEVVSTQFSLDQGMTLLALNHILSVDGENASSRALASDPSIVETLTRFYEKVDQELKSSDVGPHISK